MSGSVLPKGQSTLPPDKPSSIPSDLLSSLIAGGIAGGLAKTTIAPLDRTKIYFQTTPSAPFSTRTVLIYLYQTYKTTGFISLYRGNSATMARIIPYSSIQFASHEQYKKLLSSANQINPKVARFLAGSLAGITAQSLTYPLDMTRARLATSPKYRYKNLADVFVKIYRTEGVLTLYNGYVPTLIGVIPYAGCSFFIYESLKKWFLEEYGQGPGGVERLAFGAVSGVVGQTCSYPLDIVRRRMQVEVTVVNQSTDNNKSKSSSSVPNNKTGPRRRQNFRILRLLYQIATREGIIHGLYKGLSMNWIKGPIAAGISFSVFDYVNIGLKRGFF